MLPYMHAYQASHREVSVFHRTIRTQEDLSYYLGKIPKGARSFVYIACHGEVGWLDPSDKANRIPMEGVCAALKTAKEESISFLHFGCCEFLQPTDATRRNYLSEFLSGINGGHWVSGYTRDIDWLSSTLLDLALISEVYVPWWKKPTHLAMARKRAEKFVASYEQLARSLGFSALARFGDAEYLIPQRLR